MWGVYSLLWDTVSSRFNLLLDFYFFAQWPSPLWERSSPSLWSTTSTLKIWPTLASHNYSLPFQKLSSPPCWWLAERLGLLRWLFLLLMQAWLPRCLSPQTPHVVPVFPLYQKSKPLPSPSSLNHPASLWVSLASLVCLCVSVLPPPTEPWPCIYWENVTYLAFIWVCACDFRAWISFNVWCWIIFLCFVYPSYGRLLSSSVTAIVD